MPRYLKVRGKVGTLVPNPHIDDRHRHIGQKRKVDPPKNANYVDLFEPTVEIVTDHQDLRSAASKGELEILGETIAINHAEASRALAHAEG